MNDEPRPLSKYAAKVRARRIGAPSEPRVAIEQPCAGCDHRIHTALACRELLRTHPCRCPYELGSRPQRKG